MKASEFFRQHPIFTHDQFATAIQASGSSKIAVNSRLSYHLKAHHIFRLRRRLYHVLPPGSTQDNYPIDPYLVAGLLADDAALAYHTALGFFGKVYSHRQDFVYLTSRHARPFALRGQQFKPRLFPKALSRQGKELFGVDTHERLGVSLRVTSLERTLVDVLDEPSLSGGWEEVWRSLELIEFFDLDKVIEYASLLGNATTVAKVGLFLEKHRDSLSVTDSHLEALRKLRPKEAHYVLRGDRSAGRFVANWNLIVPTRILESAWEEPS